MSEIRVNNITNRDGSTGTTVAGIPVVDSTSHFVVPTGRTGQRYADGGENIVRDGLVLHLDAKYSYPSSVGIGTTTSGATASPGSSVDGEPYTWYDMSGNENHGQLVNLVGYNASNGGSLVFDGVNDYIQMSYPPAFFTNYTLSCWFNMSILPTSGNPYALVFYGNDDTYQRRSLFIWDGGGGGNYRIVSSTYSSNILGDTQLSANTWYNATVTLSSNGEANLYLNGISDGSGTNLLASPTSNVLFVGKTNSSNEEFTGNISQVTIYDRVLTAAEVLQNYNALKDRFGL